MRSGGLEKRRVVREEAGDEFEPRFMGTFCFKVREGSALSDDIFEFSEKSKKNGSAHKASERASAYTTTFNDGADENANLSLSLSLSEV